MSEGLQLYVSYRAGISPLNNETSLRWMLSVGRRLVRLPVPSCASQQGLILLVVVKPSHHDVLIPDAVRRLIALVQYESVHIRGQDRM